MKYRVYYMKSEHFRDGISGLNPPTVASLSQTHTFLREIEAASLGEVYSEQQAHHWAKDWRATNAMLDRLGLGHTSMSVGDVIEDPEGKFWLVAFVGFEPLKEN